MAITIESLINVVHDGISLGVRTDDDILLCFFDELPPLFNDGKIRGVMVNITLISRAGLLMGWDTSMTLELFWDLFDLEVENLYSSVLLAVEVSYSKETDVKVDVFKQWNIELNTVRTPSNIENIQAIMEIGTRCSCWRKIKFKAGSGSSSTHPFLDFWTHLRF